MIYRVFDGRCIYELITNDRFVENKSLLRFCVYIETTGFADTALLLYRVNE